MRSGNSCLYAVIVLMLFLPAFKQGSDNPGSVWFPYFDFDPVTFKDPPRSFGPFTRWWWPGNDVTNEELRREVKMFADNGFAGVEIQPLTMGINPDAPKERLDKVYSWYSPSFYGHVKTVMEQAAVSNITVDLNGGSGWPLGGPQVMPEESMLTLAYSDTIVEGGKRMAIRIPKQLPDYSGITIFDTRLYKQVDASFAKLQSLNAAKIVKTENGQTFLDAKTIIDLTDSITGETVNITLPSKGNWSVIAYWSTPDGQIPTLIASRDPGLVANHFDSMGIFKNYDHLFGGDLGKFYGKPFRAVFNDSYEFRSDRHYCDSFISFFKKQRGYDITPWLGACLQKGYNNNVGFFLFPGAKPPFVFSDDDWRIQYDYDLTVGELLQQQFIRASNNWMNKRGMLHRTQAYGVKTDVIASSGAADIPEAEQLFAKGSEGFIKLVSSGAHLYNRPVVSQESFVFLGRSEMTTPQKIKSLSDKAFTCGINQVIYSGTSYKYHNEDYGKEGWNTWSTPYSGFDFSSNVNESFAYWNDIKEVNQYIARCQYVLRSGAPRADVLIYFPFIDFTQEDLLENPGEMFVNGYFKNIEPAKDEPPKQELNSREQWFKKIWPVINALNTAGITWEWVNDASLQAARDDNGSINIRGNKYNALVIADAPYMQTASAERALQLAKASIKILVAGDIPGRQPGFSNHEEKDRRIKNYLDVLVKQPGAKKAKDTSEVSAWAKSLSQSIKFSQPFSFTRTIDRVMKNGSLIKFIWNQSAEWQQLSFNVSDTLEHVYWFDAVNGKITRAAKTGNTFQTMTPPYGSVILYASRVKIDDKVVSEAPVFSHAAKELLRLDKWNIQAGTATAGSNSLFDWRNNDQFRYQSAEGVYTTAFNLDKNNRHYIIDLGEVYFTASIKINGKDAGKTLWYPYELDITTELQNGSNTLEIAVVPTARNAFIKEAANGNSLYKQFKGMENTLMPAGLKGPVRILEY